MADTILFSNNGVTTITSGITDSATSISVSSGAVFESPGANEYQLLVIMPAGSSAVDLAVADIEIVKLTTRSTDTLTVTREQESTVGKAWVAGSVIAAVLTKGIIDKIPQGLDPGGDAKGTNACEVQSYRTASTQVASGQTAVAVGIQNTADGITSVSMGFNNTATSVSDVAVGRNNAVTNGTALGESNTANGNNAVVVGDGNRVAGTDTVVGGSHNIMPSSDRSVDGTVCWGVWQRPGVQVANRISGIAYAPVPAWPIGSGNSGSIYDLWHNVNHEVTIFSHPVCLGDGPAWSTAASKDHGDVVLPIIPNTYSYFAYIFGTDYFTSATTHATTEPTPWPTTEQDSITDNTDIDWICMNPYEVVYLMPDYTRFIPIAVGFITDKNSGALTGDPSLRFGSATGTPADWLAAVAFDNLANPYFRQEKPVLATSPASKILTAGVVSGSEAAGDCTGRFFWRGIVVETMES